MTAACLLLQFLMGYLGPTCGKRSPTIQITTLSNLTSDITAQLFAKRVQCSPNNEKSNRNLLKDLSRNMDVVDL